MKYKIVFLTTMLSFYLQAQKPILPDFHADPSAHEWDQRFWIYPSHDLPGSTDWNMIDWHVFSSKDLINWKDHGAIFSLSDITWADRWAWAPDCMKRNEMYYFYFTADDQIGVAVSDKPDGPFKDVLAKPLITRGESGTRVMDPAIFIDDDGQAYIYFGQNHARVVKLKEDMITRDDDIIPLEVHQFHEGIWVHKNNKHYYVSYCSHTKTGDLHSKIEYAIGESPLGPFYYQGEIIDNRSRNVHHSIVKFGNQWYLFYHVQGPSWYERRVCAEYLSYNNDGTIQPITMTREGVKLIQ
jgi:arabinoxylan arabinofuranohydrolase